MRLSWVVLLGTVICWWLPQHCILYIEYIVLSKLKCPLCDVWIFIRGPEEYSIPTMSSSDRWYDKPGLDTAWHNWRWDLEKCKTMAALAINCWWKTVDTCQIGTHTLIIFLLPQKKLVSPAVWSLSPVLIPFWLDKKYWWLSSSQSLEINTPLGLSGYSQQIQDLVHPDLSCE